VLVTAGNITAVYLKMLRQTCDFLDCVPIYLTVSVRPSIPIQGVKSVCLDLGYTNIPLNSFAKILLVVYL